jgi:hypothetical protein
METSVQRFNVEKNGMEEINRTGVNTTTTFGLTSKGIAGESSNNLLH